MKIKLLSDLHLEGRQGYANKDQEWSRFNNEDVLILAGDIAVGVDNVDDAICYFRSRGFTNIIYIHGNHEGYQGTFDGFIAELRHRMAKVSPLIHVLDADSVVKIQDVSFFGGTLWTNFREDSTAKVTAQMGINDFRVIKGWGVQKCYDEFQRQAGFIKHTYENTPGKKVIVTHFLPAIECIAKRYHGDDPRVLINYYFANDLGEWIKTLSDTTWVYGHTHDHQEHTLGDTRLFCNPAGYSREDIPAFARFNPTFTFDVN